MDYSLDSRELSEWMAYEQVAGPLGPERSDVMFAIVAATVANTNRAKGKPAAKIADFIPKWDQSEQTPQDHKDVILALNAAFGGTVRTRGAANGDAG